MYLGDILREVITELEASLGTGRFALYIPGVVVVVLTSGIQAVNGDNTRYY
jgi:hypothetical protein